MTTYIVIIAALAIATPALVLLLGYCLVACVWLIAVLGYAVAWSLETLARLISYLEHRSLHC